MTLEEEKHLLSNWRGRRLLICNTGDLLVSCVEYLGVEDGSELPRDRKLPNGGMPPTPTPAVKREIINAIVSLQRLICAHNDGGMSDTKLQRF